MGVRNWMLVYADGDVAEILSSKPKLDRERSRQIAEALFPDQKLSPIEEGTLFHAAPRGKDIYIGSFPGVTVVAAGEFALDNPSELPDKYRNQSFGKTVCLHAMHSVVDWAAFAVWRDGELVRSLSLSPDSGIIEDIGEQFEFEKPYWQGEHPAIDPADDEPDNPYPFVFHPLEMGEAALLGLFGYELEGAYGTPLFQPEDIPLLGFSRKRRKWWKFW